jgi:hypothetical protein
VGFEGVGFGGIAAPPDLPDELVTRYGITASAIQALQNAHFLRRQTHAPPRIRVKESVLRRPEQVVADLNDRILARLMRTDMSADARDQHFERNRLDQVVDGACVERCDDCLLLVVRADDESVSRSTPHNPLLRTRIWIALRAEQGCPYEGVSGLVEQL